MLLMACGKKSQDLILTFGLLIILINSKKFVNGEPQVPCYFIFGDSLVDAGNNDNLKTTSKVNYSPYGVDFPHGPTGRFTNGRTVADLIGEFLGFDDFIPSFSTAKDSQVTKGINYASGSAGILVESGKHMGENVDLNQQLKNHQVTVSRIAKILGNNDLAARQHLNKCLYMSVIGNNDYINNYYMPNNYNSSKTYTPAQFADVLIKQYSQQLRQLYKYGARKVGVASISSIGCTPNATAYYGTNGSICVDKMNFAANIFNRRLAALVARLNLELKDSKFIQMGSLGYDFATKIPGIVKIKIRACCELNEYGFCIPNKEVCKNRNLSLFWDSFHPTEIVSRIVAGAAYIILQAIL